MKELNFNAAEVKARFWQVAASVSESFPLEQTLVALRQLYSSEDLDEQTVRHRANAICFEMVREKLQIRDFELAACRKRVDELEASLALNCFNGHARSISVDLDTAKHEMKEKTVLFELMSNWQDAVGQYICNGG